MGKVAAIQMTSSHVVDDNLVVAARLLREAKAAGAVVACLPENFSFLGMRDADKLTVAEADGDGPVQAFLREAAASLEMWILAGSVCLRSDAENRTANASLLFDVPRIDVPAKVAAEGLRLLRARALEPRLRQIELALAGVTADSTVDAISLLKQRTELQRQLRAPLGLPAPA